MIEGSYLNIYDGQPLLKELFFPGQPNEKLFENCAVAYVNQNGFYDNACNDAIEERNCVCQFEEQPILSNVRALYLISTIQ